MQIAAAQNICDQGNVSCIPAQYTPWKYSASYSPYFATAKWYDSPGEAYDDLVALAKSRYCYFSSTPLSGFTPFTDGPDTAIWASFTTTLSSIAPSDPMCGRYITETPRGVVSGYRSVSCPPGTKYMYLPTGSVCTSPIKKVVVIDPGHGLTCPLIGQAAGAIGVTDFPPSNPPASKLREDYLTVAIALEAERLLSTKYKVVLTKRDANTCPTLKERGRIANNANAKAFVSVHINAPNTVLGIDNPFGNGTSALYNSSKSAAKSMADQMSASVSVNLGTNNRGSQANDNIAVLKPTVTNMIAVLIEVARLSGKDEQILHASGSTTKAASGIQSAVQSYLGN